VGVIDEAWSRPDNRTELGMRPAMLTRTSTQMWIMSMIPGLSRALPGTWPYLRDKRTRGRALIEAGVRRGTALFDMSAPEGLDPADPATWRTCMPALAFGRVDEQKVRDDFDALLLVDFCAEYLGWEPVDTNPRWSVIRQTTWDDRLDVTSTIAGRPVFAAEISDDREHGWIGTAGGRADGNIHVEIVEPGFKIQADQRGTAWMLERLVEVYDEHDAYTVVIDPRRPAASLIPGLRKRGVHVTTPNQGDMHGACGRFFDATGEVMSDRELPENQRRLYHIGQTVLDQSLGQARKYELGAGAFTFVKKGETSELGPLYVVVEAMHGYELLGDDWYDVADTIDQTRPCGGCGRMLYMDDEGEWLHASDDTAPCRPM